MNGLVLTGGGARAAYQAGVLQGIAEILGPAAEREQPFPILAGVSAGAINVSYLAARASDFPRAAVRLATTWRELKPQEVIKTNPASLGGLGARWLSTLSLGGLTKKSEMNYLLDTTPLGTFISTRVDFSAIQGHVDSGAIRGLAISATNYSTGTAVTFYDTREKIDPWLRSARIARRERISATHVLASSAIPIFFAPVRVGGSFYGDGCIRMHTPISPAIHLGADRVVAIGIRYQRSESETREKNESDHVNHITMADIGGTMLNAIFLDSLDSDIERMERINRTLALVPPGASELALRPVPVLAIRPSVDLGTLASEQFHKFPWMLRYLMAGLGASAERGWDLLSYLAFDASYTGLLVDLGRADAHARKDELRDFILGGRTSST